MIRWARSTQRLVRIITLAGIYGVVGTAAKGAGLTSGEYHFEVPYSPVCLNGMFPLAVGEMTSGCSLDAKIDASGNVVGTLDLRTLKGPITGKLKSSSNGSLALELTTTGQDVSQVPSQIQAERIGGSFVGTATTQKGSVPASLDVNAAEPLRIAFDLNLIVGNNGQVNGSGAASGCGIQVPVTVTGATGPDTCSLHITGKNLPDFVWDGSGKTTYTGFNASYTAKGFGVSVSGINLLVTPTAGAPALLANISTRLAAQTGDNVLIGGFIITGTQPKKVIIRALGPSLPVSGRLGDPKLELHDGTGATIGSNDNWKEADNRQAIIDSTVPPPNDKESAILASLSPGAYTAIVSGVGNTTGVALVEVYDLDRTVDSKLANISTRGFVQTGDNVLIGGFIVLGTDPQKVIVRAIGPSLPLANRLNDPTLELHDPNGGLLAANDDWASNQGSEILATKVAPTNIKEAAVVATLIPGGYTAVVRGANDTTGVAVVEAYGLNP